jgi:hypothetical protein
MVRMAEESTGHTSRRWTGPFRLVAALIVAALVAGGGVAAANHVFPDVDDGAFYAQAVRWALDNEITTGVGTTGEFQPEAPTSRGEMVVFLQRLDALVAERHLATGPVTMTHPPASAVARFNDPMTIALNGNHVTPSGAGRILVPLTGPAELGGRNFVFSSVEYCVSTFGGAVIGEVAVLQSPDGGAVVPDGTDRSTAGCYTYSGAGSSWVSGQAATLQIDVTSAGSFRLDSVTSTWVPS